MILKIKTEQGEVVKNILVELDQLIAFGKILHMNDNELKNKLPLIYHIDPYTDTYVNSIQAEMYIKEFEDLLGYTNDEALKAYCLLTINELKNLEPFNFLVFFGD